MTLKSFVISLSLGCALAAPFAVHSAPLSKGTTVRVLPLGDSITEGKFLTTGGYRQPLQDLLKDAGYNITYVGKEDNGELANDTGFAKAMANPNHEGYGSIRIDQIIKGGGAEGHSVLPINATLDTDKPDVVLLMIGTNDLLQTRDLHNVVSRLDSLLQMIFANKKTVKLVVAAPTPMAGERDKLTAIYGSAIPLLVEKYKGLGFDISEADMYSALDASDLGDGVHPNATGYAKMANVWFQVLTGITPKPIVSAKPATPATPATASGSPTAPQSTIAAAPGKQGAMSFSGAVRDYAGGPFCLGFKFTTGPDEVVVTGLGYLNDGATGEFATHSVGIYADATKELVTPATQVTTSGGDLTGENATFTYLSLPSPVHLSANTTYVIGGTTMHTGFLKHESGLGMTDGISPASAVAVYEAGPKLTYPSHAISTNGAANIGPNFITAKTAASK